MSRCRAISGRSTSGRTLIDDRTLELWRKLSARTFRSLDANHFGYSDPRGTIELRKAICDYLRAARAVKCDPEQIVVTAGTQQAIDIVIRILPNRNKEVWVEDPGYPLTRQALLAAGATVHPIPVDGQGIDVGTGIRSAPNASARVRDTLPPIPDRGRALDGPPP